MIKDLTNGQYNYVKDIQKTSDNPKALELAKKVLKDADWVSFIEEMGEEKTKHLLFMSVRDTLNKHPQVYKTSYDDDKTEYVKMEDYRDLYYEYEQRAVL